MRVKIGKTVLRINVSFAAVVTLMLILDSSGLCALALFCCVLHEAGHIIVLFILGESPERIELSFYGVRLERREPSALKSFEELAVYAAGPVVNLALSAILFSLSNVAPAIETAAVISLCVGVFNLLPCAQLDGGNILLNILKTVNGDEKAGQISFYVSCITLVPMTAAGVIIFLRSGNITLIAVTAYIAVICYSDKKNV